MHVNKKTYFDKSDSFMTVHHLTIHGTNYEIGQKLAELTIERYGQSPNRYTTNPVYAKARRKYFQHNYPIHWERIRGVAEAYDLDPMDDHFDLSNLWYNIDIPVTAMGCSVVYYPPTTTVSNSGYLSRNYDFSIGTMAEVMHIPVPPEVKNQMSPVMSEPFIMEWYPEDGGYSSLAIHAFDTLSGTLDGMNSEGLVVSIMADEEAIAELGPKLELHPGPPQMVGLYELQLMRFLLDTCATIEEAKEALLTVKQYYAFVPCHYVVADKAGNSFIFENSTGRNKQYIIDGLGQSQVVTNFQVHKHPINDQMSKGALTLENNAFWRYLRLSERISEQEGLLTPDDLKANNACVNIMKLFEEMSVDPALRSLAANVQSRTLWHSLYDQQAGIAEFSFYLGDNVQADGTCKEQRSEYLIFKLG
jgi:predicted choloylglycine hydrolase